jgi:hypothetical protein
MACEVGTVARGCSSTCSLTTAERLSRLVAHMGKPVGLFVRSHRRR